MLLPRFTIRTLLVVSAACAAVFVIVGAAVRGQYWAWGVTIGIACIIVTVLVHAAWYGVIWLPARMLTRRPKFSRVAAPAALPIGEGQTMIMQEEVGASERPAP